MATLIRGGWQSLFSMSDRESYAITAAVWLGSLVVVGGPTFAVTSAALGAVTDPLTGPETPGIAVLGLLLVTFLVPLAISLSAASETVRVRLHGWDELQRGSVRRRVLRHAVLAVPALAVLLFLGATAVEITTDGFEDHVATSLTVLALLGFGLVLILVRSARAFLAGREAGAESGR